MDIVLCMKHTFLKCSSSSLAKYNPTGLSNLQAKQIFEKKRSDVYVVMSNDMFHYMLKAEFVKLLGLKVPSGRQ